MNCLSSPEYTKLDHGLNQALVLSDLAVLHDASGDLATRDAYSSQWLLLTDASAIRTREDRWLIEVEEIDTWLSKAVVRACRLTTESDSTAVADPLAGVAETGKIYGSHSWASKRHTMF